MDLYICIHNVNIYRYASKYIVKPVSTPKAISPPMECPCKDTLASSTQNSDPRSEISWEMKAVSPTQAAEKQGVEPAPVVPLYVHEENET